MFLEWGSSILIALIIAVLISIFIIQPSNVFGHSMEPTLNEGDWVIISRLINTFSGEYDYGDIVIIDSNVHQKHTKKDDFLFIFKYNGLANYLFQHQPAERYWIKRIIGKEDDILSFEEGQVFRNGEKLEEPYLKEQFTYASFPSIKIPKKHVFVLGDNRNNSGDSRIIGPVPIENVLGKMIFSF